MTTGVAARIPIFMFALLVISSCSRAPGVSNHSSPENGSESTMILDGAHLKEMETRARSGDVDAMRAVAAHYDFARSDPERAIPWLEMAVEHGSVPAMRGLAIHLAVKGGEDNCTRAEQLFVRALRESDDPKEQDKIRMSYKHFQDGAGAGRCGTIKGDGGN